VQEYRRARKLLDRQKDLPDAARLEGLVRLDLKIIRGLRLAGLNPEARAVLEEMPAPQLPAQQQELAETRARILSDLDERRAFLAAVVEKPSAEHLRNRGAALAAADDWPGAVGAYLQLWRDFPGRFTADDATYLLIAANRAEDLQTLDRVARAFPSLTSSKEIVELARGINEKAPELMPLHAAAAEERLERLRSTFDLIKNTTGTPAD
jgi:tetratricopeptide (TPR) repeat protein